MQEHEPIAITGIGCRFPGGAHGPEAFWKLLCEGVDAVTEIPPDRWNIPAYYDPEPGLPGKTDSRWGGFIDGIDQFDPAFFGISPREAAQMDPQQRLVLETAWESLEDAGMVIDPAMGSDTGVFLGMSTFDYWRIAASDWDKTSIDSHTTTGTVLSVAANRISYFLNLRGPSLVVDSACSSSLTAVHLACRSLRNGECSSALAGGINAILIPDTLIGFSRMSMLSPDGRCKAFDARANGFVRGEGVGVVVLKPLSAARADGDPVIAVIRGSAVNQDGRTSSLTVPGGTAQTQLIREACRQGKVDPVTIDYVETHGTGTAVGDPIEATAIGTVVGEGRTGPACVIGSVKTNIGHLESGSGIAGLIKTALVLRHGEVPPNLHFENPNPNIDFEKLKLRVPTARERLPRPDALAGVNSFGFGGTNAHAILQAVPQLEPILSEDVDGAGLLVLSANGEEALRAVAARHADWLTQTPEPLAEVCANLATRRLHRSHRIAVAADSKAEMAAKLEAFVEGETRSGLSTGVASASRGVVFVFSGQGPQWWAMGRELLGRAGVFRDTIEECDALFGQWGDWSLREEMSRDEAGSRMELPSIAQPAIFALQIGLARWWEEWGITPSAVIGHSVGEAASAHLGGALDLPAAARVIFERGRCMELVRPGGKMLAVALSPEGVKPWMAGFKRRVEIGAVNSPHAVTLSGEGEALGEIARRLEAANIWHRFLRVNYAFHSGQMDPVKRSLRAALKGIRNHKPTLPIASAVSGKIEPKEIFDGNYWWRNVRERVRFSEGIAALTQAGFTTFLEISPHPALSGPVLECLRNEGIEGLVTHSLRRGEKEQLSLLGSLGALHTRGVPVRWQPPSRAIPLPLHPWQHARYWNEAEESTASRLNPPGHPLLGRSLGTAEPAWELKLNRNLVPYLDDHQVHGRRVFPAAAYVEMALAAGRKILGKGPLILEEIEFERALFLPEAGPSLHLGLQWRTEDHAFRIHSRPGASTAWTPHSRGKIRSIPDANPPKPIALSDLQVRCPEERSAAAIYELFCESGLQFGPAFQNISRVWRRDGEALAEIVAAEDLRTEGYHIHPTLLDACFQALLSTLTPEQRAGGLYLPVQIERLRVYSELAGESDKATTRLWSHVQLLTTDERSLTARVDVLDESGNLRIRIDGFRCAAVETRSNQQAFTDDCLYEMVWCEEAIDDEPPPAPAGGFLLIRPEPALAAEISSRLQSEAADGSSHPMCEVWEELEGKESRLTDFSQVVYFAETLAEPEDQAALAERNCAGLLDLVQRLATADPTPRLTVVTRCAQPVEDRVLPAPGALLGLARVAMNEHPGLGCRLIDLGAEDSPEQSAALLAELRGEGEDEVALRAALRRVPRLARANPPRRSLSSRKTPFRLEATRPGVLDQLTFCEVKRRPPGPGEVELKVRAAGLNFRDVMKALGIYPIEKPLDRLLGDECAGVVTSLGDGVSGLAVGDKVIVISPGCFSQYYTVPAAFVVRKPSALSFEEAVTVPVTFLTAHYALLRLARVEKGERVLIHAAAGGVGLAALQIARLAGAEVFATAGNDEKRDLVRRMGAAHVMDSRSLDFAQEIMEITGGRGVDVVLNSLAGEAIPKSLAVLAPYGRFLEIGKRDIYENHRLGLRPFSRNLSFFAIDLGQVLQDRPEIIEQTQRELMDRFAAGNLAPLPHRIYPIAQAADAFREMASGRHSGKIVFSFADPVSVHPAQETPMRFRADASYLLVGGVGGVGRAVAKWMIGRGAKNLVLIGSREASAESARKDFADTGENGVTVVTKAVDVSDKTAVEALFDEIARTLPPLRGVMHAAMKVDDGVLRQLDAERLHHVMAPKAGGAWNLHTLTRNTPLDFFVMFSSFTSLVGNPGQGNYAAANAFLDALAAHRRGLGLPALTINWGHLGGVGYTARHARVGEHLDRTGFAAMAPEEVLARLDRLLQSEVSQVAAMRVDWSVWTQANTRLRKLPQYRNLIAQEAPDETDSGGPGRLDAILNSAGPERETLLEAMILEMAARVLGTSAAQIDIARPLSEIGLDSLMSIELVNRLEEGLQIRVPVEKLVGGPSIHTVAGILAEVLPPPEVLSTKALD